MVTFPSHERELLSLMNLLGIKLRKRNFKNKFNKLRLYRFNFWKKDINLSPKKKNQLVTVEIKQGRHEFPFEAPIVEELIPLIPQEDEDIIKEGIKEFRVNLPYPQHQARILFFLIISRSSAPKGTYPSSTYPFS